MPAFNAEKHIAESIRSALHQSFDDLEVLVVDNNSTDRTAAIAEQLNDSRVSVLNCKKQGAAAARNLGIRKSTGRYIQFLDADDVLDPQKIERQLAAIERKDPIRTIASCAWQRFDHSPTEALLVPERVWTVENPLEWLLNSLSGGGMMQTGAWLVHRDLIAAAGPWNEALSLHDDGEFFARVLLQAESQVFVPEARIYYRVVAGSLSRQRNLESIQSAFKVCQLRDKHLLAVEDTARVRAAIATQYAQFAYEFSAAEPELSGRALERIRELGARPVNSVGGKKFRGLIELIGFQRSLALRNALRRLVGSAI